MAKTPRTYVASLTMRLGPATVRGRLKPVKNSGAEIPEGGEIKLCTPDGNPIHQRYISDAGITAMRAGNQVSGTEIFERGECGNARVDENGEYHLIDPVEFAAASASVLPKNIMELTVHPKRDTERWMWPSDHASYIFEPVIVENKKVIEDPTNITWYNFIREIVQHPEFDVMCLANLNNHQGLYRMLSYKGYITLQRQLYPESLWQTYDEYDAPMDARVKDLAYSAAEKLAKPFSPEEYTNDIVTRKTLAANEEFDPTNAPVRETPAGIDLADALEAFLSE